MKIKDVIKITAALLGREDVTLYLSSSGEAKESTLSAVNLMTTLANLVINELAGSYIPILKSEKVFATGGRIYYKNLSENALKIVRVIGEDGCEKDFSYSPSYITVPNGTYEVEYQYSPCNYGIDETIGYEEKDVPARVLAYGTAAEFCLTEASFEQAVTWHQRYADGIAKICLPSNSVIKKRSFI